MTTSAQKTPKAFVIGWPISHSKSPIIHNHWIKENGLNGLYEKVAVEPENLIDFLKSFPDQGFVGGNVTIPHKEAILEAVDVIHPTAQRLQAANTLWMEEGKLHADNTDGYGFLANLDQNNPNWDKKDGPKTALILGAGGAARPIIDGILNRGFDKIILTNRTLARSQAIVDLFTQLGFGDKIEAKEWDDRSSYLSNIDLLVNTTALGMTNQPALDMDLSSLPTSALVTDIVYSPLMTDLLVSAQNRGNPVVDGLGMLLHQAVPGFEKWFGLRPTVTDKVRELALK